MPKAAELPPPLDGRRAAGGVAAAKLAKGAAAPAPAAAAFEEVGLPSPPPYQPPLEAGSLGRSDHLALVPPQLARSAQRYHAAASKAVESLQAQLETLHQLECGAAALRSALGAAPDGTPRDLASELKLLGKAHRGLPGAPPPVYDQRARAGGAHPQDRRALRAGAGQNRRRAVAGGEGKCVWRGESSQK